MERVQAPVDDVVDANDGVKKRFKSFEPDAVMLVPPSLEEWLPEGHLARFFAELVENELDLSFFYKSYVKAKGQPPYDPRLMLRVLLYGYCTGVRSSRAIDRACIDRVSFRWFSAQQAPDFRSIGRFRERHLAVFANIVLQALQLCQAAGMVKLGKVTLDGTKVQANASKHKAMSYARLTEKQKVLAQEISELTAEAKTTKRGDDDDDDITTAGNKAAEAAVPSPKAQRNFTDPDARIMKRADGSFSYNYNGQAAVDAYQQVIVAAELGQGANDYGQLAPMVEQTRQNLGQMPKQWLADTGYCPKTNLEHARAIKAEYGTEFFISTGRMKHAAPIPESPRGRIPANTTVVGRMTRKLKTKPGRRPMPGARPSWNRSSDKSTPGKENTCCSADWKRPSMSGRCSLLATTS